MIHVASSIDYIKCVYHYRLLDEKSEVDSMSFNDAIDRTQLAIIVRVT